MKIHLGALLGALILIPSSGFAAPAQMHACALLTAGEIAGAVGGPAGRSQEQNITIPEGPSKGETMGGCMWRLGAQDMLSVSVVRALQGAQREAALAGLDQANDALRTQGWSEDKKMIGDARCSMMTPPRGQRDVPLMTGCMAEAKGMALSVGFMSPTKKVPVEQLKTLLDKAAARLP